MKRIFPLITTLILLSLLGIIFFQVLWIKGSLKTEEQKFNEHVSMATYLASEDLMDDKESLLPLDRRASPIFQGGKLEMDFFKPTVIQRYSKDEIQQIIRKSFDKQNLKNIPFEFAISSTSIIGDEIQSDNFFKLYRDSINNKTHVVPLEYTSNNSEGISPQELLIVIVPHLKSFIWKSMTVLIIVAIFFTVIILSAFFITIRALLKQKKLSEIKSDFINNMTHEFKTPLATISLAVDALKNDKVNQNKEKINYFTGIIKEENKRMNKQVETILQAALLDKQDSRT